MGEVEFKGGGGKSKGGGFVEQFDGGGVEGIKFPEFMDMNGDGIEPLLVAVDEEDVECEEWERGGGFKLKLGE